jgi:transposase
MSTTTKSPRKVLVMAYATAQNVLPAYAHRFSPHKFTLPQLFACLVLKTFLKLDYRGIMTLLEDCPDLSQTIHLRKIPHFTTLQKASPKLLRLPVANRLLLQTVQAVLKKKKVSLAAIDSTGLEAGHISAYFVRRRSRVPDLWQTTQYTRFPKLAVICDCRNHLILGALTTRGPSVDVNQFREIFQSVVRKISLRSILADAGYDSEANHRCAREEHQVTSIIPAKCGRPTRKKSTKKYRRLMQTRFPRKTYGQRWQVETVFSMIKRRLGFVVHARSYWAQNREMLLMVLTHNLAILLLVKELFYRACQPNKRCQVCSVEKLFGK